jgi:hypothetical protein
VSSTVPSATINTWLRPFAEGEQPPLSDRLIRALEAQAAATAADVASCRHVAKMTADPAVELLVDLIVDDAQRHDALMRSMIRRLEEEVEFVSLPGAAREEAPMPANAPVDYTEIVATVRGLIRNEHEAARHLRHLGRQEPTLYDGLYPLLLETIARDSEKHATILRYLLRRLEERAR